MNRLGDTELRSADRSTWITKDAQGGVEALVWDYTYTLPTKDVNNQQYYIRDLPPVKNTPTRVQITHLKPGRYALELYRVGYRSGDAYTSYIDVGRPSQLTREEVDYLKSASADNPVDHAVVTVGADGTFAYQLTVRENDLCFLQLKPTRPADVSPMK
jgi:xylan 1,4-beta-xylosidase